MTESNQLLDDKSMDSILVVEDEPKQALAYQLKLGKKYEVVVAKTTNDALEKLARKDFGLILLDIMLPGSDNGFDLLREIKSNPKIKEVPVMVVTNLDEDCRKTALSLGAIDYVIKSNSTLEQLSEKINSYFQQKR